MTFEIVQRIRAPKKRSTESSAARFNFPVPLDPHRPGLNEKSLFEFTLTLQGRQTRLRVVETGFSPLPRNESERAEQFKDNTEGWASELRELQQYVEQLPV
jgi:hypothetical protein